MAERTNKSLFRRLTALFRGGPVVKRKIRNFRTPTASTATEVFKKSYNQIYSNALNAYGQYDRMSRYADFCFGPETLVYTTRGVFSIKDLAENHSSERFKVYSYDHDQKCIVIADAHSPRLAREGEEQELLRITFDDNGSIDVTPDHKMMLRDGSYIEAKDLNEGMSLMPFYVRDIVGDGYNWIYSMNRERSKGGWISEHLMVMEHFIGRKIKDDECVHHIDFDRSNNLLENLKLMNVVDHQRYHAQLNNKNKFGKSNEAHSSWMYENNPVSRNDVTYDRILDLAIELDFNKRAVQEALKCDGNMINRRLRKRGFKNWVTFREKRNDVQELRTHQAIVRETRSPEIDEIIQNVDGCVTIYELAERLSCTTNAIRRRLKAHGHGTWSEFKSTNGLGTVFNGKKSNDPAYDDTLTYQMIYDAFDANMSMVELADKLGTTHNKVYTRIINAGFKSFSDWTEAFNNHKVISIEHLVEKELVYNITVEKYHNLAMGSFQPISDGKRPYSMVICSQSEMEYTPEIASALDLYSEESTSQDEKGNVLHIYSENPKIRTILEQLFFDTLNIEFNLGSWTRNLVKYGDFFLFNDVSPDHGVINAFPIPVNEIEREEGWDPKDPLAVRFRWVTQGNQVLENWQVTHFRLLGNDAFLPYGSSVLESARRIWRQLVLIEDAMLVYRVVRSPERRVFYIDVGTIATDEIPNYMEAAQSKLKRSPVIDRNTGRIDLRYNPLSVDEDYFIPRRGETDSTKIDTLPGGTHVSAIEDVEYIQRKLFSALKVPKAYLGYDDALCLTGDTCVPLLDGRVLTVEEMAKEHEGGKTNWTYSCSSDGCPRPGRVTNAWATKQVSELYDVTLDDGSVISCTDNHPFLCRDGVYRRADELVVGQSLMPCYRRESKPELGDTLNGYDMVMDNKKNEWRYTHQVVAHTGDVELHESFDQEKLRVTHHKDFNKKNNSPENLIRMGRSAHAKFHIDHSNVLQSDAARDRLREVMKTEEYKENHSRGLRAAWKRDDGSRRQLLRETNRKHDKIGKMHEALAIARAEGRVDTSRENSPHWIERPDFDDIVRVVRDKGIFSKTKVRDKLECSLAGIDDVLKENGFPAWYDFTSKYDRTRKGRKIKSLDMNQAVKVARMCKTKRDFYRQFGISRCGFENYLNREGMDHKQWFNENLNKNNHKVVRISVRQLEEPVWVYDVEVEDYHNFAILGRNGSENGAVYVHNSSKATLSQEDIRFSRSIQHIQRVLISELNKVAIIHLYAHGYEGDDLLDFVLQLSNPSTIAQQQMLDLYRTKFEIAGTIPEQLLDKYWIRKNILGLTNEEIRDIDKGLLRDQFKELRIQEIELPSGDEGEEGGITLGGGGGGGGLGGLGGGGLEGEEGEPEGEPGEEEEGGDEPIEEPEETGGEEDLFASEDVEGDLLDEDEDGLSLADVFEDEKPITPDARISRTRHNRRRRRRNSAARGPDFKDMLSPKHNSMSDPYDMKSLRKPFGEGIEPFLADLSPVERDAFFKTDFNPTFEAPIVVPILDMGLQNTLKRMAESIGINDDEDASMLTEVLELDVSDVVDAEIIDDIDED